MQEFLKRLKLIDSFNLELKIQKSDFVERLKIRVKPSDLSMFSDSFSVFSANKKEYIGTVRSNDFRIKKRKRFFDFNLPFALANGTLSQKEDSLVIETQINGFPKIFIVFYIFLIIFYGVFIMGTLFVDEVGGNMPRIAFIPFIVFHATVMMGMPYLFMRRSVKKLKYDLEREFYFLTR